MPITADQVKARILAQVGDTAAGDVSRQLGAIWDQFADKATVAPRLQELYSYRAALEVLLGVVQKDVDQNSQGEERRQSQTASIVLKRLALVQAEIAVVEKRTATNRPGVIGVITKTAPIPAPILPPAPGPIDANDPRFSGSPYASPFLDRGVLP